MAMPSPTYRTLSRASTGWGGTLRSQFGTFHAQGTVLSLSFTSAPVYTATTPAAFLAFATSTWFSFACAYVLRSIAA